MKTIIIILGKPGSGKSYSWEQRHLFNLRAETAKGGVKSTVWPDGSVHNHEYKSLLEALNSTQKWNKRQKTLNK